MTEKVARMFLLREGVVYIRQADGWDAAELEADLKAQSFEFSRIAEVVEFPEPSEDDVGQDDLLVSEPAQSVPKLVPQKGVFVMYWERDMPGPKAFVGRDVEVVEVFVDGNKVWEKK